MEQKLVNEEKARIFAMYIGQNVRTESDRKAEKKLNQLTGVTNGRAELTKSNFPYTQEVDFSKVKLLLIPLQDITDEDAVQVMQLEYTHVLNGYETLKIERNDKGRITINFRWKHLDSKRNLDDGYSYSSWATNFSTISKEEFQYLIQKGYAVPLFFGVNHWTNGKTAIDLGIAINKNSK